ncbi:u2 small nuclear ribonucleoprotein a' [Anaeramoeba ignava]|uniref:U2 small nuclear ribonucleoprotein a n=1 Tax=Anaeramoeba ignava TaxID=1746090 RepID=A0A9Q0LG29_ANAIG|nr:u2 small nuclear ribonucleoprotein a' [Anaeramoeba ignava]
MPRLTVELILSSPSFTNPLNQRELTLRGNRISTIENLGSTLDQYEAIDFINNEIVKLDNFPLLKRLETLLLTNNRISKIGRNIWENLPNLQSIVLSSNLIADFEEIDNLSGFKNLSRLSLQNNPICLKDHYRLYVIYKIPSLKTLDYRRIRLEERKNAQKMFANENEKKFLIKKEKETEKEIEKEKDENIPKQISKAQFQEIQKRILNAQSTQEIEELEKLLKEGIIEEDIQKK